MLLTPATAQIGPKALPSPRVAGLVQLWNEHAVTRDRRAFPQTTPLGQLLKSQEWTEQEMEEMETPWAQLENEESQTFEERPVQATPTLEQSQKEQSETVQRSPRSAPWPQRVKWRSWKETLPRPVPAALLLASTPTAQSVHEQRWREALEPEQTMAQTEDSTKAQSRREAPSPTMQPVSHFRKWRSWKLTFPAPPVAGFEERASMPTEQLETEQRLTWGPPPGPAVTRSMPVTQESMEPSEQTVRSPKVTPWDCLAMLKELRLTFAEGMEGEPAQWMPMEPSLTTQRSHEPEEHAMTEGLLVPHEKPTAQLCAEQPSQWTSAEETRQAAVMPKEKPSPQLEAVQWRQRSMAEDELELLTPQEKPATEQATAAHS